MENKKRLTRGQAIRKYCLECCNGSTAEVEKCSCINCSLYEYRKGKNPDIAKLSKVKAIRKKCLNCSGGYFSGVKECKLKDCSLYRYRMGAELNQTRLFAVFLTSD